MYINFPLFEKSGLQPEDIYFLAGIKQTEREVIDKLTGDIFNRLEALKLLTSIKGKKGDNPMYNIRLSPLGKKLLEDIETPEVTEQHLKMRDYLIEMYLSHEDKERVIGNKKLIGIYISVLQNYLGLDIYRFYYLCEFFLSEHIFTKKLENIFMDRNKIRYGEFKNHIEDSALYNFYEQRKSDVEYYWAEKIK